MIRTKHEKFLQILSNWSSCHLVLLSLILLSSGLQSILSSPSFQSHYPAVCKLLRSIYIDLKTDFAYLNRIYHMGKEELLSSLGRREGGRVQLRIETELNRIEHNMRLTKNRKLEDLRRKKQQERSCDSVNIENWGLIIARMSLEILGGKGPKVDRKGEG